MADGMGMNASDVALLARDNDGFGGGSWWAVLIILFALMGGNWGNGFGGNGFANAIGFENLATSNEVQRGFDNQSSMANQREILAAVNAGTMQSTNTVNQVFHDLVAYFGDKYNEITRDIGNLALGQAALQSKQQECCCETLRAIDGVNYNVTQQVNGAVGVLSDKIQGLSDMIVGNRMADMQNRINNLETGQMLNPILARLNMMPTYPNGYTYNAGPSPFCTCPNGMGNI